MGHKNKHAKYYKRILATFGLFSSVFILTVLVSSMLAPTSRSNADVLIFDVSDEGYTASVSSANTIELDVTSTPTGTLAKAHDTVNVVTNNPEGYTLYISMNNVSDYSASKPGNALYLDGNSTSDSFISPATGTLAEPAALGVNQWGFSLTDGLTFAKVPLKSHPEIVSTSDSATTTGGNDLDVYYGVNVNSALPSGSYTGVINYSVLSDYSTESTDSAGVYPSAMAIDSANLSDAKITISTNLYTNRTFQKSEVDVTIGEEGEEQDCDIDEVSTETGHLEVTADLPDLTFSDYGTYTYPVTLSVPSYGKTYAGPTLTITYEKPASDFWSITTMQEMTPEVCATVYTPTNAVSMTDANIITLERYRNGDYDSVTSDNSSPLVPERTLVDDRDADGTGTKKSYKVRKLADGNCWMVENLAYDLLSLYNNGKRGIGSRNDGTTFEMTDANLATGVAGYYDVTTTNAYNYVINQNTKSRNNVTRESYLGNTTGQTEYYYNWTGATAGQGSQTNTSDTVDGSICPAGWRLPANYTDVDNRDISWGTLMNVYLGFTGNKSTSTGYQTLEQYPISLYRAGNIYSGNQYTADGWGYYWTGTAFNANSGRYFYYQTDAIYSGYDAYKYYGLPVRCLATR